MTEHTDIQVRPKSMRSALGAVAIAIGLFTLMACSSAQPTTGLPQTPAPSLNGGLPPFVDLVELTGNPAGHDGQTVLVTATYYSGNGQQLLCDSLLESYPPQPGGHQLSLSGSMPAQAVSQLQSTQGQANVAQVVWGQVSVIGIFHVASGSAAAYLEMQSVRVEQGGVRDVAQ